MLLYFDSTHNGLPSSSPRFWLVSLIGAQGNEPFVDLPVPERLRFVPPTVPFGPPQNVGHAYIRMAEAIQEGNPFAPSFEDALEMHRLLEAIQQSSDEGRVIKLV